jgi:serine/threonine protein kinase
LYTESPNYVIKRVITKPDSPSQEDAISLEVNHPNIVRTFETFKTTFINYEGELQNLIWLKSEYIKQKISQRFVGKDESIIREILHDALVAIDYLHSNNIIHLDLKIANVMGQPKGDGFQYKLIDFGYSRDLSKNKELLKKREVYIPNKSYGTYPYKPPEVVKRNIHGMASDIWCIGSIAWFLSLGKTPFYKEDGEKNLEEYRRFVSGDTTHFFKDDISLELEDFILACMNLNRKKRPTARMLLQHPFITGGTLITRKVDRMNFSDSDSEMYSDE